MFVQPTNLGWIEVICGPMFSGKTEELIRRLRRADYAKQRVQIFKPAIDDRYAETAIVSHNQAELPSVAVSSPAEIENLLDKDVKVVGIDEIQFFSEEVTDLCDALATKGCRVIVAGLDIDYRSEPFGPMPRLLSLAEEVTKLSSICMKCGNPAHYSYRLATDPQQVLVGATDAYEARCRNCYHGIQR